MTKTTTDEPDYSATPSRSSTREQTAAPKGMKYIFGIFMICIYLGMGYLMLVNFFSWTADYTWVRYGLGLLFIVYGLWRGYRQFTGKY